jgi:hypothetical protein
MADCSTDPIRLCAMMYTEDVHAKGGNNVASLMWYNLERLGIIAASATEPFKEINFVMDNCGGQNKNRMCLRMLFYLVKKKICKVARLIFLIRGHTKNDCDRLFNLIKKDYRKSNTFTPKDLTTAVSHEHIDAMFVDYHTTFRDWDAFQNLVMKPTVGINVNHCFTVDIDVNDGNSMHMMTHHTATKGTNQQVVLTDQLLNTAHWELMPELIPPKEMLDIKWLELFDKWGDFVPPEKLKDWKWYSEDPEDERRE